ncbi:MAG: aldo/keto reductase [Nitrospinota bacterium]
MKKVALSKKLPGVNISELIFGSWGIGGEPFWSNVNEEEAIQTIIAAFESGVTMIDTAPVYGFGHSEEIIGKAIKRFNSPDPIVIATKVGLRWKNQSLKSLYHSLKADSIEEEVNLSLKRLNVETIDLLQIHWPDPSTRLEDSLGAMTRLKERGKIKAIGVSNFSKDQLAASLKIANIVSIQPQYSMLWQDPADNLFEFANANDVATIVYSPLASGLLTGKYSKESDYNDWRGKKNFGLFAPDRYLDAINKVEQLKIIAAKYKIELTALAIRWVLRNSKVTGAIIGAKTAAQAKANAEYVEKRVPTEIFDEVDKVLG